VHDDLPCMDDDAVRRGRPTVHKAFDVETATIAGVAMVPLAVRVAMTGARELGLPAQGIQRIVRELMLASGASGMVGGQWLDLDAAGAATTVVELERMHRMKTGALLAVSGRIGALAAGADDATVDAMAQFGADVGLAFQIVDDVLDVTSTSDVLGKTAGSDASRGKRTYATVMGVEDALQLARTYAATARQSLQRRGVLTEELDALARHTVERVA
jgi:farnesyl diphosphate synthase